MKRGGAPAVTGASSLLVIFAVLCLTVFALLGLTTAQAGARLSDASAASVQAYYQADARAEELFARLRAGELPEGVLREENLYTYTCTISETQTLHVTLQRGETGWTVLRWQAVAAELPAEDSVLNVWDGN